MKTFVFSVLLLVTMTLSLNVSAGDIKTGQTKSATCSACHGSNGISAVDSYPNLAGQHADYIIKQLQNFKSGERENVMMASMAATLSDEDMADLAAYYTSFSRDGSRLAPPTDDTTVATKEAAPVKIAPAKLAYVPDAIAGKGLYELGDNARGITACIACHGKEGYSEVLINPNLANQHSQYIEKQLNHFKDSSRKNAIMNQISANLTAADIANIGAYFADTSAVGEVKASSIVAVKSFIGDINAGKAKSATCAACHGADGNAAISIYPSLAGQSENYLVKQLQDFKKAVDTQGKSGRVNAVMGGMSAILSADDMQNLAAYFASQTHNPVVVDSNEAGKKLFISGDPINGTPACMACHTINGKGMGYAAIPAIAGQSADYLTAQLEKFRNGERGNDKNTMMRGIARKLSDKDMAAVSQYMASLK